MSTDSAPEPKVPKWASKHFTWFADQTKRLGHLLNLTTQGISGLRGMPQLVEAIRKAEPESDGSDPERLDQARRAAELAEIEVGSGFPMVHAQYAIALWSYLEACIRALITDWLRNRDGALEIDVMTKIKVPVATYHSLSETERLEYLFTELERQISAGLRKGVNRFETILAPFGLSGPVPEDCARDLFELAQVRNLHLHRGGRVDRDFNEACPWLDLESGQDHQVTHADAHRYAGAVSRYSLIVFIRVGESFGCDMSEFKE